MNELALFAGAGGGILGGKLLGWRTVCAVEWEPYPASVLCARQNDGLLPPFPIWDDVQTFDGHHWRGIVDVISGGFPCQDISAAGKGKGIDGERSGMWGEMARIIHEVRPRFVFVENSPMLTSRGLGRVLGDLASMGFDARWGVLGAADVGANHQRDRIWIVAKWRGQLPYAQHDRIRWWEQQQESLKKEARKVTHTNRVRLQESTHQCQLESQGSNQLQIEQSRDTSQMANSKCKLWNEGNSTKLDSKKEVGASSPILNQSSGEGCGASQMANSTSLRQQEQGQHEQPISSKTNNNWQANIIEPIGTSDFWTTEPNVDRVVNGVAARVDRLKAIGNGQVPMCAAAAWRILTER